MSKKLAMASGSKNVFEDLGFSPAEAKDLELRSELMIRVREMIAGKPQKQVAVALGVSQPRVSDLVRGKLHLFSMDALVTMLERLGASVQVVVRTLAPEMVEEASARYESIAFMVATTNTGASRALDRNDTWRRVPLSLVADSKSRGDACFQDQAA